MAATKKYTTNCRNYSFAILEASNPKSRHWFLLETMANNLFHSSFLDSEDWQKSLVFLVDILAQYLRLSSYCCLFCSSPLLLLRGPISLDSGPL